MFLLLTESKFTPAHAKKACVGRRGTAPQLLHRGIGGRWDSTVRLGRLAAEEAGWATQPPWTFRRRRKPLCRDSNPASSGPPSRPNSSFAWILTNQRSLTNVLRWLRAGILQFWRKWRAVTECVTWLFLVERWNVCIGATKLVPLPSFDCAPSLPLLQLQKSPAAIYNILVTRHNFRDTLTAQNLLPSLDGSTQHTCKERQNCTKKQIWI
jgi:hypothetical protein